MHLDVRSRGNVRFEIRILGISIFDFALWSQAGRGRNMHFQICIFGLWTCILSFQSDAPAEVITVGPLLSTSSTKQGSSCRSRPLSRPEIGEPVRSPTSGRTQHAAPPPSGFGV